MRVGVIPENMIERIALRMGFIPTPFLATLHAVGFGRAIMGAAKLGVFEALTQGALTASEVAARCVTDPRATEKLLNVLVGAGYLRAEGYRYALAPVARKWLLKDSSHSLYDSMLYRFLEWEFIESSEEFLRSGKPIRMHEEMSDEGWELYQRGMRSLAGLSAREVARRTPVPKRAQEMLDIGGSHDHYSVAICRRHRRLRSTVLDLPEAIKHAAPILAKEGMGDRVVHRTGNALTDDLGTAAFDLVFVANLVHHFDDATNRDLARRIARALRPGGYFVIMDVFRVQSAGGVGQIGALADLYFALTSEAGSWSREEMAGWQREAGLVPQKPVNLTTAPGFGLQAAVRPTG